MKKYLFIIAFIFISCEKEKTRNSFNLPTSEDLNSIVEKVIIDDSLAISKNNTTTPICNELKKIKIINWDRKKNSLPPKSEQNSILIQDLIGYEDIPVNFFFKRDDSLYIEFQNEKLINYSLSTKLLQKLNTTSILKQKSNHKNAENYAFYNLSIPILSANNTKAYIELTLVCSGLCGEGYKIYLEKKNGKWIIVKRKLDWVS